jgi:hypothetical protein
MLRESVAHGTRNTERIQVLQNRAYHPTADERVYVNGVWQIPGEDYTIDYSDGTIIFTYDLDSEDDIVVYYKLPKWYYDGEVWSWTDWWGIPHLWDLAQIIGSGEEYVGFAGFWPTLSDYTVDGWAKVFNPLLNVSQPDMIPPGSEPDVPFVVGRFSSEA